MSRKDIEVTIEITKYCENDCYYCSSNASIKGEHLDLKTIENFLKCKAKENIRRINISGGEPLAHPDFYKILRMCEWLSTDVRVYTNVLKHITYNTDIIKEVTVDANVCLAPGKSSYIPKNINEIHLLKLVPQGKAKNIKKGNFHISGKDCVNCNYSLLQADGKIVPSPCKKDYDGQSSS